MESKSILFVLCLILYAFSLAAQDKIEMHNHCQTKTVPMSVEDEEAYRQAMQNLNRYQTDSIIIPVVVHNMHWNRKGYVADSLIHLFLARTNQALANEGEFYDPEGLDTRIRLCLAAKDTLGEPTSGILHYEHLAGINRVVFFERSIVWDINTYLNLHLTDSGGARSTFPWDVNGIFQGISMNTNQLNRDLGVSIMVHEIGHYLGLLHPNEDLLTNPCLNDDCLMRGDFVCDTRPDDLGYAFCFLTNTCVSDLNPEDPNNIFKSDDIDTPFNYMGGGTCLFRFTPGQVARMHWAAETFLSSHKESGRNLCNTCRPVSVDFGFLDAYAQVGKSIDIANHTEGEDLSYTWYVDDEAYSDAFAPSMSFDQEGFYRIRLEVEDVECGLWSNEKVLHVRCSNQAIQINYPALLLADSCYVFDITGVASLAWRIGIHSGDAQQFDLCLSERGMHTLYLSYAQGSCEKKDSLVLFVYDSSDLQSRDYTHSVMGFTGEKLLQENVHISKTAYDEYLVAGQNTQSLLDTDVGGGIASTLNILKNYIRTWRPQYDFVQEWEIYEQNILSQALTDSLFIQSRLEIREVYRDTEGFTYVFSRHGYAHDINKEGFYVMKIDVLGNLVWNKFIYPRTDQDHLFFRDNVQISEVGEDLMIYYGEFFLQMSKEGEVLESKNLVRGPSTTFPAGISDWVYRDANEEVIFQFNRDREHFPEAPDSLGFYGIDDTDQLMITLYNHDLEVISEQVYVDDYFSIGGSLAVKALSDGAILYFRSDDAVEDNSSLGTYRHYFIKLNNQGELVWKRAYENIDSEDTKRNDGSTYLDVLDNGDIVVIAPILDGRYTTFLRLDGAGDLIESRHYANNPPFEPLIVTIRLTQASKIGTRGEDGYMFIANKGRSAHEALIFQHIPLDSKYDSCVQTDTMRMTEIDFDLNEYAGVGFMEEIPMVLEVADAPVSIRRKNYSSLAYCGSSHEIEDYTMRLVDSICIAGELKVSLEICRQRPILTDSLSLLIFESSPFTTDASLFQKTSVMFGSGDRCQTMDLNLPSGEHHIVLNGKSDYKRPFTLETTFFDAAENLEYNYTNNYVQINACEGSVSTMDENEPLHRLQLFPNPTSGLLHIEVESSEIRRLSVFNVLGQNCFLEESIRTNRFALETEKWEIGSYIVQVELNDGSTLLGRFVKL